MADEKKSSPTWIHIDMTTVCVLIALCLGAWGVKAYFNKIHNDEIASVERAKFERKMKEEEDERKAEEARVEAKLEHEKKEAEAVARNAEDSARNKAITEARNKAKEEDLKRASEAFEAARKHEQEVSAAQTAAILEAQAAAERKRKDDEAAARNHDVGALKDIVASADKDIAEANKQLEPMRNKMIAFKNHMDAALKQNETLRKNIGGLQTAQSSRPAGGTSLGFDLSEEMIKQAGKQESVNKDFRNSANGYTQLVNDKARLEQLIIDSKARKESALNTLKSMGVAADAPAKPVVVAPAPTAPKGANKIYIMKDGKKFVAVKSIEAGDTISIKLESGKFEALNKDEIEKIVDE